VEAHRNKKVIVLGLPTSNAQRSVEYGTEELGVSNGELQSLQLELRRLRMLWLL
jgi:hypothetical protein